MESVSKIEPRNITTASSTKRMISIPIPIPKSQSNQDVNNLEEYSLQYNSFNPSKMSPPDPWKDRLQQRLLSFNYNIASNEKNK